MAAENRSAPGWLSITGGLLVGGILLCLPEAWAGKIRSFVHDGLAPGQCVIAAAAPQVTHAASPGVNSVVDETNSSSQRQARYWQAEAARLRAELAELQRVPTWPPAAIIPPQVQPRLRTARVIGWERRGGHEAAAPVIRAGTENHIAVSDLVLSPGEPWLDQGQAHGVSADDLVLAGRSVIGRIARTSRWTSTIQPITDPEFRGQAQIVRLQEGEAILGAEGLLAGAEGSSCRLLHIGTTDPVAEGDLVFTSLHGVPLSPPLFYGTITKAELKPGEPDWSIEVTPARLGPPPSEVLVLELSLRATAATPTPDTAPSESP